MGALATSNLTLLDLASRMEKGMVAKNIVELLAQYNEIIDDMVWKECNDATGHKTTVRTGIPTATWRLLYQGVTQTKSVTAQIRDACGMLENYSTVDAALVGLAKDKAAFRLSEDVPFIEGMNQGFAQTLFYGNTSVNPERFTGLSARFNALSADDNGVAPVASSENVISGGGVAATNTSIWIVNWGELTCHGIYPEGSEAGLTHQDLGEQTVYDANNNPFQAFRSHYKWFPGLTVRDWRHVVRIPNIDVKLLTNDAGSGADLIDLVIQGLERIRGTDGRPAIYCNRRVRSWFRRQMTRHPRAFLTMDELGGKKVLSFDGIPVRRCDQLLNTEAAVL